MNQVPCLRLDHMSEAEKRAYVLADNELALNAGWDEDLLAAELGALMFEDLDFDVGITGFTIPEIDNLMETVAPEEPDDRADDIVSDEAPTRAHSGDIWQLGSHRLICGDAFDAQVVGDLMGRELAQFRVGGSIHFVRMDWRHMTEMLAAGQVVYDELKNLIVWTKDNGGMGTFYRSRHELIFAFKKCQGPHINNFELGQHGRYRTNVWQYRGVNTMRAGRMEELALHPTVKPVQMIADAIRDVSGRGDIVLDTFGGSGSTLIAAEKTGRRGYLCEMDRTNCDRTLARWEAYAKDDAEQLV